MIGEKMELNEDTLQILKNFASINSNIVFDEGSTIKTISEAKNILSEATISESFPQKFGVYDLNEFKEQTGITEIYYEGEKPFDNYNDCKRFMLIGKQ